MANTPTLGTRAVLRSIDAEDLFDVRIERQTKRSVASEWVVIQIVSKRNEDCGSRFVHLQSAIVGQPLDVIGAHTR